MVWLLILGVYSLWLLSVCMYGMIAVRRYPLVLLSGVAMLGLHFLVITNNVLNMRASLVVACLIGTAACDFE